MEPFVNPAQAGIQFPWRGHLMRERRKAPMNEDIKWKR